MKNKRTSDQSHKDVRTLEEDETIIALLDDDKKEVIKNSDSVDALSLDDDDIIDLNDSENDLVNNLEETVLLLDEEDNAADDEHDDDEIIELTETESALASDYEDPLMIADIEEDILADEGEIIELTHTENILTSGDEETILLKDIDDDITADFNPEKIISKETHEETISIADIDESILSSDEMILGLPETDTIPSELLEETFLLSDQEVIREPEEIKPPKKEKDQQIPSVPVEKTVVLPDIEHKDIPILDESILSSDDSEKTLAAGELLDEVKDSKEQITVAEQELTPIEQFEKTMPAGDLFDEIFNIEEQVTEPEEKLTSIEDLEKSMPEDLFDKVTDFKEQTPVTEEEKLTSIEDLEKSMAGDLLDKVTDFKEQAPVAEEKLTSIEDLEKSMAGDLFDEVRKIPKEVPSDEEIFTPPRDKEEFDFLADISVLDDVPIAVEDIIDLADIKSMSSDADMDDELFGVLKTKISEKDNDIIELNQIDSISENLEKTSTAPNLDDDFRIDEDIVNLVNKESSQVEMPEETITLTALDEIPSQPKPASIQDDEKTILVNDLDSDIFSAKTPQTEAIEETLIVTDLEDVSAPEPEEVIELVQVDKNAVDKIPSEPPAEKESIISEDLEKAILLAGNKSDILPEEKLVENTEDNLQSAIGLIDILSEKSGDIKEKKFEEPALAELDSVPKDKGLEDILGIETEVQAIAEHKKPESLKLEEQESVSPLPPQVTQEVQKPGDFSGLSISPDQVEAVLERVIRKMFSDKIEHLLMGIIEKAVTKEMNRLKDVLIESLINSEGV